MEKDVEVVELIQIDNILELGSICALLENHNIPFFLKEKGSSGYMRILAGSSIFGSKVMVAKHDLDRAKDLLEGIIDLEEET